VRRFAVGLLVGLVLGGSASAWAAGCFGYGMARGWTVTKDGDEVCSDPNISDATHEIECD
jgi:hypothetical protein